MTWHVDDARITHRARRRLVPALVALATVGALTLAPLPAMAAEDGKALSATRLAAQTYPGVQLIQADFASTITVPEAVIDEAAVNELYTRLVMQAASGTIGTGNSQLIDAFVAELAKDPFHYVTPTDKRQTVDVGLSGFGTGFVVNADGYMVTAAHVVAPDKDELKVEFARAGLSSLIANDIQEVQSSGVAYSQANLDTLAQAFQQWYVRYLEVGEVTTTVSAQIGVAIAGVDKTQRGQPAEVISVGAPYPGKDVAVLKLDGAQHIPTLPLGQDDDVPEGSTLHVAGYPAASTFSSGMSTDSQVQPTITEGPLTAIKKTSTGMPVFQTQAPASPGNSGGPVLDDTGEVVGILVASATASDGSALEGQEFVIPVSVVRQMLNENNISPSESDTTTAYDEALDNYFQKYYKRAMPQFERVRALYPEHPYVADYITKTQQGIDQGKDETPKPLLLWVGIGLGALVLLALVALGIFLMMRRRPKTPAVQQFSSPQQHYAQQPYPHPQGQPVPPPPPGGGPVPPPPPGSWTPPSSTP